MTPSTPVNVAPFATAVAMAGLILRLALGLGYVFGAVLPAGVGLSGYWLTSGWLLTTTVSVGSGYVCGGTLPADVGLGGLAPAEVAGFMAWNPYDGSGGVPEAFVAELT